MEWMIYESIISFLEMLISCSFAAGIFRKNCEGKKRIFTLILFSISGAALLTLREYVFLWIPDFVPAVLIFTLYAIVVCRAKWWAAVSWALVNYLFIGIITIAVNYILGAYPGSPAGMEKAFGSLWFFLYFYKDRAITAVGDYFVRMEKVSGIHDCSSWKLENNDRFRCQYYSALDSFGKGI